MKTNVALVLLRVAENYLCLGLATYPHSASKMYTVICEMYGILHVGILVIELRVFHMHKINSVSIDIVHP